MPAHPCIVWFQHDLRLGDNPALQAAVDTAGPVVPLFVWSPDEEGDWPPGAASRWWLHHSLAALEGRLQRLRSRLILRVGPTVATIRSVARATQARSVFWNQRFDPAGLGRDREVRQALTEDGLTLEGFNGSMLFGPEEVRTKQQTPFQVYTAFWNACKKRSPAPPLPGPEALRVPKKWPASDALADLRLLPTIDWAAGLRHAWQPGEAGARVRLESFLGQGTDAYAEERDRPDLDGTSSLSPHLHFGEISPRTLWHEVHARPGGVKPGGGPERFLKEVVWREFAYQLLYHFPDTAERPLRRAFAAFPWRNDAPALLAWQRGHTGYPIVDAGMRQLWAVGWMHNRVRMVVASFLVKHLLLPWQTGARWFWDTLVDADLASNTLGWQWVAGCGADAAPYFRVFNPVRQGEKFDPHGAYVRRWVPELARLPDRYVHKPWEAPPALLAGAGVTLGETYPAPLVDHRAARARALEAFASTATSAT